MSVGAEVDASALVAFYDRKISGIQKGIQSVAVSVTERIATDLRSRLIRPKRINVQDANGQGRGRDPVSVETGPNYAQVTLRPHWTVARSGSLADVARRTGSGSDFERDGLWVSRSRGRSQSKGYRSRSGLVFKSFSSNDRLREWAHRRDRGMQYLRHAIWIGRPEIWKPLLVQPVINRALPGFSSESTRAVRDA